MKKGPVRFLAAMMLLILCAGAAGIPFLPAAAEEVPADAYYHGEMTTKDVWPLNLAADQKYRTHRIPGIVVTKKDTVIIYCEARTGDNSYSVGKGDDWCMMDIFIQRSTDGGETFGDPIYIAKGTKTFATTNNPVMIVGNDNTLHMLYCRNYSIIGGGLWYRKSIDDGLTWSEAREVTAYAASVPHDTFAFGPTHGICTSDGVLMAPVWLVPKDGGRDGVTSHGPSKTYVFYSRDNGATWALSQAASSNGNETDIAELSDGRIYLNSRSTPRKITTSPNGVDSWTSTYADQQLPDPGCCAGLVRVDIPGLPVAHLFSNCASEEARDHVTVRCSFDDCVTWDQSLLIAEFVGGYSDIAVDSKGCVYVLYEVAFGNRMRLARLSFVDEFCSDPLLRVGTTDFPFADEASLAWVSRYNHVEGKLTEEGLLLTATETKNHGVTLDYAGTTKNINLSRLRAVSFRVRVNATPEREFVMGTYFQCGRVVSGSTVEKFNSVRLPNDGEWHTVILDLAEMPSLKGMLRTLRLEFFSDTLRCEVGDTVELAGVTFWRDANEAREVLFPGSATTDTDAETDAPGTEAPTQEDTAETEPAKQTGGCKSSADVLLPLLASPACAVCVLARRKKKR